MSVSMYPCSVHGKRINGRLETAYPSVVYRSSRRSRKLRLCPGCLTVLMEDLGPGLVKAEIDSDEEMGDCCVLCDDNLPDGTDPHAIFVTVFRRGSEREDWFGQAHADCAADFAEKYGLTG